MAKKKQETQNKQTQENKNKQTPQETQQEEIEKLKKEPFVYTGEPIVNEKFFLRPGQIFMEIPAYVKDEKIREKFVPISQVKNQK